MSKGTKIFKNVTKICLLCCCSVAVLQFSKGYSHTLKNFYIYIYKYIVDF